MKTESKKFHNKLPVGQRSYRLRELGNMAQFKAVGLRHQKQ